MRFYILAAIVALGVGAPAVAQIMPACHGDEVVWVNTRTGVEHRRGMRWFGATKEGKYICRKAADAEGDRMTRNGQ